MSSLERFKDHYANIVENTNGKEPTNLEEKADFEEDRQIVKLIVDR